MPIHDGSCLKFVILFDKNDNLFTVRKTLALTRINMRDWCEGARICLGNYQKTKEIQHHIWGWENIILTGLIRTFLQFPQLKGRKRESYPCNRPWRPIGLWDVEAPKFSRQSAHRWRWGCQPYAPPALYPPGKFLVLISVRGWVYPRTILRLKVLGKLKKSNDLIENRNRNLAACSLVPKPTTLPRQENIKTLTSSRSRPSPVRPFYLILY
jgi:hypothetical protein